ncbi:DUF3861 domain-containing protein [Acinetobacter johnsonii]|uniref:DUF3861 domain-containing protein n=1 Tax=Acinetobacter johnsonii TaxID=40214 RepID=UPI000EDACC21|nr:DUF3861 domain-containing protein [Acinetobacter johnsonii]
MKQHTYEVTLKHMTDAQGNPSTYTETLSFNSYNHDDIFKVLDVIQNSQMLNDEAAKSFAVSLKLFSEVMLEHKNLPLFKDFMPHFGQFMKALKQTVKTPSQS